MSGLEAADKVSQITIVGNTSTSDRLILKNIKTREGSEFLQHIINEDIKRLYDLNRFEKIEYRKSLVAQGVKITFLVKEKPLIRSMVFVGLEKKKVSDFNTEMRLGEGVRYDRGALAQDKAAILKVYRDSGFLLAKIESVLLPVPESEGEVDLKFILEESDLIKIGRVEFLGNDHVGVARLSKMMETRVDKFYNKGVYDPDIFFNDLRKLRAYYQSVGYLDAKVTYGESYFSENKKWLYLKVLIEEGSLYIIDDIIIEGNEVFSDDEILRRMKVKVGMPYSEYVRLELEDRLEKFYGEKGRIFTRIKTSSTTHEKKAHVSINIDIRESDVVYIESIKILGNVRTRDVVLRRELEFYPLEKVNSRSIQRSRRNLMRLGFFEKVEIFPEPGSEEHLANFIIRVKEKLTGSINFSLGFSSIESVFAMVKYSQRNFDWRDRSRGPSGFFTGQGFIGDGQSLELGVNTGTRSRRFTLDFREPWVFNRKIRFGYGLFHTESSIADFDERRDGSYVQIGKEFREDLEGSLTYNISKIEISDIGLGVSPAILAEEGKNTVSSLRNEWIYDNRDSPFFPTQGWFLKSSALLAGGPMGGSRDFFKLDLELKAHKKVYSHDEKSHHVLSGRIRVGMAEAYGNSDRVPIFERYFVGGLGSVRGFETRSLGPKDGTFEVGGEFMNLFNLEYSVPFNENVFRGVVFYDQGFAWDSINDFDSADLRSSVGIGIRLQVDALGPFPISLDFAKPLRKKPGDLRETFSFNFGNFF